MAIEAEDQGSEEEVQEKGKSSKLKLIIIAVLATVLLAGGLVGATVYFVSDMLSDQIDSSKKTKSEDADGEEEGEDEEEEEEEEEEDKEPKGPAIYHSMDPKFVVSFRDQQVARFMQFSIEVMTRDKGVIELLDEHTPAIRSNLLMLFDNLNNATMSTREGKQQLLANIVTDINETLKTMTGKKELEATVESAYFTSFVIQ